MRAQHDCSGEANLRPSSLNSVIVVLRYGLFCTCCCSQLIAKLYPVLCRAAGVWPALLCLACWHMSSAGIKVSATCIRIDDQSRASNTCTGPEQLFGCGEERVEVPSCGSFCNDLDKTTIQAFARLCRQSSQGSSELPKGHL